MQYAHKKTLYFNRRYTVVQHAYLCTVVGSDVVPLSVMHPGGLTHRQRQQS